MKQNVTEDNRTELNENKSDLMFKVAKVGIWNGILNWKEKKLKRIKGFSLKFTTINTKLISILELFTTITTKIKL